MTVICGNAATSCTELRTLSIYAPKTQLFKTERECRHSIEYLGKWSPLFDNSATSASLVTCNEGKRFGYSFDNDVLDLMVHPL